MTQPAVPRSRENTRARLLAAASEVFAELGLEGASVEAICERAGFTRGAFYSNFASKEELLLGLMQQVADQKLERVTERVRELGEDASVHRTVAELVTSILDVGTDGPTGVVLMSEIRTNAMRDKRLAEAYLAWEAAMAERVADIVADVAGAYRLRLRIPAIEFARLVLDIWDATCAFAVISGLAPLAIKSLLTQRTATLAAAVTDSE
ncbi:TetR/AcrR family transcriptional regulator [Microbacterium sp. BG28]|uniref:TetR/AcrR family transcriptional regulator n=1 Tax=Microbacterium sp. BG28 TaxID=3097356 RepID=UPI002A5B06A0|nr:TetR/AcrR family transcriptional regulator [Microbacterium sp. BG28]MDY0827822.1 TetR/AcrR family transcriptional regulator [Microbacterium sp. BG28]